MDVEIHLYWHGVVYLFDLSYVSSIKNMTSDEFKSWGHTDSYGLAMGSLDFVEFPQFHGFPHITIIFQDHNSTFLRYDTYIPKFPTKTVYLAMAERLSETCASDLFCKLRVSYNIFKRALLSLVKF